MLRKAGHVQCKRARSKRVAGYCGPTTEASYARQADGVGMHTRGWLCSCKEKRQCVLPLLTISHVTACCQHTRKTLVNCKRILSCTWLRVPKRWRCLDFEQTMLEPASFLCMASFGRCYDMHLHHCNWLGRALKLADLVSGTELAVCVHVEQHLTSVTELLAVVHLEAACQTLLWL